MILFPPFRGFVRTFVFVCGGVFILQQFAQFGPTSNPELYSNLVRFFGLTPELVFKGMVYQLVTWMFLHGSFIHLLFNMFGFWMFGSLLEELWGTKRMVTFTLLTGLFTGLVICLFGLMDSMTFLLPTIGASGVVFATLIAVSRLNPDQMVLFFFVFPMRMKYFAYLMVLIEFYALYTSNQQGISNIGHLGGALFGFLYVSWTMRRRRSGRGGGSFGGSGGGNWFQRLKDQWHHRRMRKKIRVIKINGSGNRTTYH